MKNMNRGTVKFFNYTKGYGFIIDESQKEYFVHVSDIETELRINEKVIYEVKKDSKGYRATKVRKAEL